MVSGEIYLKKNKAQDLYSKDFSRDFMEILFKSISKYDKSLIYN